MNIIVVVTVRTSSSLSKFTVSVSENGNGEKAIVGVDENLKARDIDVSL